MKKNARELYGLAVCFAAALFLVVSTAVCLYELVRLVAPTVTMSSYDHHRSQSDEQFLLQWPENRPAPERSEVPRLRAELVENALWSERHEGLKSFLQSLMYALAAGVAFRTHWRLAGRERRIEAA